MAKTPPVTCQQRPGQNCCAHQGDAPKIGWDASPYSLVPHLSPTLGSAEKLFFKKHCSPTKPQAKYKAEGGGAHT